MSKTAILAAAAATGLVLLIALAAVPLLRGASGTVEVKQLPLAPDAATAPIALVEVKQLASPVVEVEQLPLQSPPDKASAGRVEVEPISMTNTDHAS